MKHTKEHLVNTCAPLEQTYVLFVLSEEHRDLHYIFCRRVLSFS